FRALWWRPQTRRPWRRCRASPETRTVDAGIGSPLLRLRRAAGPLPIFDGEIDDGPTAECDRERHQPARSDLGRRPFAHTLCRATREIREALRPRECGPAPCRDPRPPCLGPPARSTLLDHRAAP